MASDDEQESQIVEIPYPHEPFIPRAARRNAWSSSEPDSRDNRESKDTKGQENRGDGDAMSQAGTNILEEHDSIIEDTQFASMEPDSFRSDTLGTQLLEFEQDSKRVPDTQFVELELETQARERSTLGEPLSPASERVISQAQEHARLTTSVPTSAMDSPFIQTICRPQDPLEDISKSFKYTPAGKPPPFSKLDKKIDSQAGLKSDGLAMPPPNVLPNSIGKYFKST